VVRKLIEDPSGVETLERVDAISFVIARLVDDIDSARSDVALAVEVAFRTRGFIEMLNGPLLIVTFRRIGAVTAHDPSVEAYQKQRLDHVRELRSALGDRIAILHGSEPGYVGDLGGARRSNYGTFFDHHTEMMRVALGLATGDVLEWPTKQPR
jgi:hypothetical protein